MPRTRRTLSGAPAAPVDAVAGQMYGMGEEQMEMQRTMPAPQVAGTVVATAAATAPAPAAPPGIDKARLMELAKGMQDKMGMLTQPTNRPNEPVTAGLHSGPGAGPEILTPPCGNPAGETLRRLSIATGDPLLRELADRAGL